MSYLVLARKYRPGNFDEVIGQEHITELLKKAVSSNRVAHAYLFCGPRGIGKTSCARILAKSLNCKDAPTEKPCGKCPACTEISGANSFDVLEIDGASNRGIDEIRTIRENVKFAPSYGNYKIYIVDEVHMLTLEAFNALLKTLEEPPEHVKFIFATTDPNKVPATIISRCQRCDFKRIPLKSSVEALSKIAKKEKLKIGQDALYAIAKASQGSFRDALSIMDQVSALSSRDISTGDIYSMLGLVETELLFELGDMLSIKDCSSALKTFDAIIDRGKDIKQLIKDLVEHFRNLMVMKIGGKTLGRLLDYPVAIKEMYLAQSKNFSLSEILKAIDLFIEAQDTARITESFRTPLEIAFAKMTYQEGAQNKSHAVKSVAQPSIKTYADKHVAVDMLKSKKGLVNASSVPSGKLNLEMVKKQWSALTHAVSREKMFLATYLQEASPIEVKDDRIIIALNPGSEFYKDSLENNEYVLLVEKIFSKKLKAKVTVRYKIIDNLDQHKEEDEPAVKAVLDAFEGKIVSKWHNE
jgi:DNA polymerase-3 subunit gamma/tau